MIENKEMVVVETYKKEVRDMDGTLILVLNGSIDKETGILSVTPTIMEKELLTRYHDDVINQQIEFFSKLNDAVVCISTKSR